MEGENNLKEVVWNDVNWIHLIHDRDQRWDIVNMATNLQVPYKASDS
jgi:hypothetical protein